MSPETARPKIATVSLAGCFGCHMSLLDLDERFLELADRVAFGRSPINDLKSFEGRIDIGFVEGGCANEDNVRTLLSLRERSNVLIAVGDCAIGGGIPAMRNTTLLSACLEEAFLDGPSVINPGRTLPGGADLPPLLDRVHPCADIVRIDHHLPGCPPSADAIWEALTALLEGRPIALPYASVKYD